MDIKTICFVAEQKIHPRARMPSAGEHEHVYRGMHIPPCTMCSPNEVRVFIYVYDSLCGLSACTRAVSTHPFEHRTRRSTTYRAPSARARTTPTHGARVIQLSGVCSEMRTNLRYLADIRFLFRMDFGLLAPDPHRTRSSFRLYAALARDDGGHHSGTHYDAVVDAVLSSTPQTRGQNLNPKLSSLPGNLKENSRMFC